jgi:hypothetical protein
LHVAGHQVRQRRVLVPIPAFQVGSIRMQHALTQCRAACGRQRERLQGPQCRFAVSLQPHNPRASWASIIFLLSTLSLLTFVQLQSQAQQLAVPGQRQSALKVHVRSALAAPAGCSYSVGGPGSRAGAWCCWRGCLAGARQVAQRRRVASERAVYVGCAHCRILQSTWVGQGSALRKKGGPRSAKRRPLPGMATTAQIHRGRNTARGLGIQGWRGGGAWPSAKERPSRSCTATAVLPACSPVLLHTAAAP